MAIDCQEEKRVADTRHVNKWQAAAGAACQPQVNAALQSTASGVRHSAWAAPAAAAAAACGRPGSAAQALTGHASSKSFCSFRHLVNLLLQRKKKSGLGPWLEQGQRGLLKWHVVRVLGRTAGKGWLNERRAASYWPGPHL